ncbi:MAG: alginate export family protein [Caulobacter sp.]|nr:alginate export family protein [Caulobacter sp.]
MPDKTGLIACIASRSLLAVCSLLALPAIAQADPWRVKTAAEMPDWLTVSGSGRLRYETLDGQFRPARDGGDQMSSARTAVLAEARFNPVTIGVEVLDARILEADTDVTAGTSEVNALEVIQAFAAVSTDTAAGKVEVTAGRFTMELGSRRLVGTSNFNNVPAAYTGARLDWTAPEGPSVTAFYTLPVAVRPFDRPSILDNDRKADSQSADTRFYGLFASLPKVAVQGDLELMALRLEEVDDGDLATRDRRTTTLAARFFREPRPGRFDYEFEASYQSGKAGASTAAADITDLKVKAGYAHLELGYRWTVKWSPRVSAEFDYGSGDKDRTDREFGRFDSLFGPRRPDFGPGGLYGPLARSNVMSPGVRLEVTPAKRLDATVFYRGLWLDQSRDAFGSTGLRDPAGRSGTFAGHQIEGRARYWLVPGNIRLEVGAAALIQGDFLKSVPGRTGEGDTLYGYSDLTFTF